MERTKPQWLEKPFPHGENLGEVGKILSHFRLHTVCQSALCPNLGECFSAKTATFMIMGDVCTRNCRFCAVDSGAPGPLEASEPLRVAQASASLGLDHVVITSVTRDDLPDGGAQHFAETITAIRESGHKTTVEVLVPDFGGSREAVEAVVQARPEIVNHNVETVPGLYGRVRPQADYRRSLRVLEFVKELNGPTYTKSGMMLGLGETDETVITVMSDLRRVGCDFLTLGQYLRPSTQHLPVAKYVSPEEFQTFAVIGKEMGFRGVEAGPFVRSSYKAGELLKQGMGA